MTGRVQTLRSSVAGNRPTGRQPGELYINFPDMQLGMINAAAAAQDLLAVRMFSTTTTYAIGDHVLNGGVIYRAIAASSAGAFVPGNWTRLALLSDTTGFLPLSGGTLTGGLTLPGTEPTAANNAATKQYVDNTTVALSGDTMTGGLTLPVTEPSGPNNAVTKTYVDTAVGSVGSAGFLNRFRNGTMDVWQRGISGTVASGVFTTAAYIADGWKIGATGATAAVAQLAAPWASPNTVFAMKLTGATALAVGVCQPIESYLAAPLAGKVCTFQARIQNNTGASITPQLRTWVPTSSDAFGTLYNSPTALTADLALTNLQPIASGATAVVSYTFTVSANAIRGYRVDLDFGSTLNVNTKNVVIGELDIRVTPGVTVGLNSTPPVPELRAIANEIVLCQRYYEASGVINAPYTYNPSAGFGAGWMTGNVYYKADKRATPTVTFANITYFSNCSALVAGDPSTRGFDASVTNNTAGAIGVSFSWTATAEL